jgi:hypothetical protein
MLTGGPYPQWRGRGGGARQCPTGEEALEGIRLVKEVAGAHAVLGEVPARPRDGRSDLSMRRASATGESMVAGCFKATSS